MRGGRGEGLQHDGREAAGWTGGRPVQAIWWLRASGQPRKHFPVCREGVGIRAFVQGGERGGGLRQIGRAHV